MRLPTNLLDLMIHHDAFRVCRLLSEREFIEYCRKRGVKIDANRLRQFEKIGVFKPLIRVFRPEITYRIERVGAGFRYGDPLLEGEIWEGETRTELPEFGLATRDAKEWRAEGLLWTPWQENSPHEATIDALARQHEAYYSQFQVHPLERVAMSMVVTVQTAWTVLPDGSIDPKYGRRLRKLITESGHRRAAALQGPRHDEIIALLLQLLANRYYYKTQDDGRQITIGLFEDWEWSVYARAWKPRPLIRAFEITEAESRGQYEWLDMAWSRIDPIAGWYKLARFVRIEQRKRLKDAALLALTLREMAEMLRYFHIDAFGGELTPIGEVGVQIFQRIPDIDPGSDPMRALELSANYFGVNSKPQLVLFVEGRTEELIIPHLFDKMWATPPSRYGIEIVNLGGVDNAAGGKEAPFSALWRLVDYLHHHQTLAFILLDREGRAARNVGEGLLKARSVHSIDRRATHPDHIKIWNTNFEFDNFSDTEIAAALNSLAGARRFDRAEIAICRASVAAGPVKNQSLTTIDRLYIERLGQPLDKPRLGEILVDTIFAPSTRRKPGTRPILKFLTRAARKAARNYQPITHTMWESNQRSGYLATLLPHAAKEEKAKAEKLRRSRIAPKRRANP